MKRVLVLLSTLHESAEGSAVRRFRGRPVLDWTLDRLSRCREPRSVAIRCWDDQLSTIRPIAERHGAKVTTHGSRTSLPNVEAITAARRWADGWRGGLLATCSFDAGFHGPAHLQTARDAECDAVVLIDPSAALIDPNLVDGLIAHARTTDSYEICFLPAAPGFGGALLRIALLERLAAAGTHPGRLLHYHPDIPAREPLSGDCCAPVPVPVARTTHSFTLDSERTVRRIAAATESLNGQLIRADARELVRLMDAGPATDETPAEIVLELTVRRSTRAIFRPTDVVRPDLSLEQARRLFGQLAPMDPVRLTLAGVGDPLLAPDVFAILEAAHREAGAHIHIETDLLDLDEQSVARLAVAPIDIVSIHLPAVSPETYLRIMGRDGCARVLENIRRLLIERQARKRGVPILVPIFTKCRDNLAEMEAWYDQWLRALGHAVIRSPSDCAGQISDVAAADMTPPGRVACRRLASRLTILSDGGVVACEEDFRGSRRFGDIATDSLRDIWLTRLESLRADHRGGRWNQHALCAACREWHRP